MTPAPEPVEQATDQPTGRSSCRTSGGMLRGLVEAGLPGSVFVLTYRLLGEQILVAAVAALTLAATLTTLRLARRQRLRFALLGLSGVAVGAGAAWLTGSARDYFAPNIILGGVVGLALLGSLLVRRPLVGVILGLATARRRWRSRFADPALLRVDMWATGIMFVAVAIHVTIKAYLYLNGHLTGLAVLGFAKPTCLLFGAALGLAYAVERRASRSQSA